ncbi:TPA: hypothetical protein VDV81_005152 [Pseudomonas aeruginosa]|nr:hypothetical protein [Pseudomonas aeruginosa]
MPESRDGNLRRNFIALVEIDRDESVEGGGWVTFDSFAEDSPGVLFEDGEYSDLLTFRAPVEKVLSRFPEEFMLDGNWVLITVEAYCSQDSVPAQVVLFGDGEDPPVIGILSLSGVEQSMAHRLTHLSMLGHAPRARAGFIAGVLDIPLQNTEPHAVAVYDVGQGNCNAIVDIHEHPRIFFDLGWAPNFHRSTRPSEIPDLFRCSAHAFAPVVLSHWDMDHWSYAIARSTYDPGSLTTKHEWHKNALNRFWIARAPEVERHQLGPLALTFYRALTKKQLLLGLSAILLWPNGTKRIQFSGGWLEACSPKDGKPADRNNSGLAMFVQPNPQTGPILLTGDADFPSIPSLAVKRPKALAGMVAPHHGARISPDDVPRPKSGSPAQVVVSVGKDNTYGHPKQDAIDAYLEHGWLPLLTQDRFDCPRCGVRHKHGNTLLKFTGDSSDPQCGCWCVPEGNLCLLPSSLPRPAPRAGVRKTRSRKRSPVKV